VRSWVSGASCVYFESKMRVTAQTLLGRKERSLVNSSYFIFITVAVSSRKDSNVYGSNPCWSAIIIRPQSLSKVTKKSGPVLGVYATAGGRPGGRTAISASCAASTSVPTDPPIYVPSEESGCYDFLQYLFSIHNTKTQWTQNSSKNMCLSCFSKKNTLYGHLRILRGVKCPHEPDPNLDFNSGDRI